MKQYKKTHDAIYMFKKKSVVSVGSVSNQSSIWASEDFNTDDLLESIEERSETIPREEFEEACISTIKKIEDILKS